MLGLYWLSGYYNKVFLKSRVDEFVSTLSTAAIGTVLIYFVAIVDDPIPDRASNYELLLILFLLLFGMVYLGRLAITLRTRRLVSDGHLQFNTLIVGTTPAARELRRRLATQHGPRKTFSMWWVMWHRTREPTQTASTYRCTQSRSYQKWSAASMCATL